MARIPDDQIERLKHEIAIQRLAESAGIALKRHRRRFNRLVPLP